MRRPWMDRICPTFGLADVNWGMVGMGTWPTGYAEPDRWLYDHELVIFAAGLCRIEILGKAYDMPTDSWCIVPPGTAHRTMALQGPVTRHWIHFDWAESTKPLPSNFLSYTKSAFNGELVRHSPGFVPRGLLSGRMAAPSSVYALAATLERRWLMGAVERCTCRAVLLEILIRLLASPEHMEGDGDRRSSDGLALRIRQMLDNLPETKLTLKSALAPLGYSYEHLSRVFKRSFGITPVEYVNLVRIERAKLMLKSGSLTIKEVAVRSGFQHASYFSRCFKERTGYLPREYATVETSVEH